jgi:predicted transcriptional regulator YdeE
MPNIEQRVLVEQPALVMRTETTVGGIPAFLAAAFGATAAHAETSGLHIVGPPFARYALLSGPDGGFAIEAGFPVSASVDGTESVEAATLPGGAAAVAWHVGPYDTMQPTYAAVHAWIEEHGGVPNGPPWEVYHSDPTTQPDPSEWRTEVIQPFIETAR